MPEFIDGLKGDNSETIQWSQVKGYNAQVKIGNMSRNIKIPVGHATDELMDDAFEAVLNTLNPRTLGLVTGRSKVTHRNDDADVPADITGKHTAEVFTFRELRGGVESYPKIIVPFYAGAQATGTADKAEVGQELAEALSGTLASYQFVS